MSEGRNPESRRGQGRTDSTVKGNLDPYAGGSLTNALNAAIGGYLANNLETAAMATAGGGDRPGHEGPAGRLSAAPCVNDTDNFGGAVSGAPMHGAPFFRLQAGDRAIVLDPEGGDKGLVVFTKKDSSGVGAETDGPVQPASHRTFDPGNGFFFGGFSNQAPKTYIELTKEGKILIHSMDSIVIESGKDIEMTAQGTLRLSAVKVDVSGPLGAGDITGNTITGNGVVLDTHVHRETNGESTEAPTK
jgi:hypothetical protein